MNTGRCRIVRKSDGPQSLSPGLLRLSVLPYYSNTPKAGDSDSCEKLIQAVEEMTQLLGFGTFDESIAAVQPLFEAIANGLKTIGSKEQFEVLLMAMPEPEPKELESLILLPRLALYETRKSVPKTVKQLPHPPGGRPRSVNPEESESMRSEIGVLLAKGFPLKTAQRRVADRRKISSRTVQRVWAQRRLLNPIPEE
jgi:hypothetical protein